MQLGNEEMGRAWHDGVQGVPRSASVGGRALSPSLPLPALEISGPYRASPEMPVLWGPVLLLVFISRNGLHHPAVGHAQAPPLGSPPPALPAAAELLQGR